ncbi:MAG: hypothetical protein HFJ04_13855 [Lachnospiraceae bacterium]|nr:hypothetical protein [Lachnospiraceae bacterium]
MIVIKKRLTFSSFLKNRTHDYFSGSGTQKTDSGKSRKTGVLLSKFDE